VITKDEINKLYEDALTSFVKPKNKEYFDYNSGLFYCSRSSVIYNGEHPFICFKYNENKTYIAVYMNYINKAYKNFDLLNLII
jgi:hypothetical protein